MMMTEWSWNTETSQNVSVNGNSLDFDFTNEDFSDRIAIGNTNLNDHRIHCWSFRIRLLPTSALTFNIGKYKNDGKFVPLISLSVRRQKIRYPPTRSYHEIKIVTDESEIDTDITKQNFRSNKKLTTTVSHGAVMVFDSNGGTLSCIFDATIIGEIKIKSPIHNTEIFPSVCVSNGDLIGIDLTHTFTY